jgi:ADP-heptose:LPS heptosyltransferase
MGDVAMTVPIIRAFTKQHPTVKITFLSKAFLKPLFNDIPNVNFYAADVNDTHKGVLGLHKLYKELKQLNITHVADLHNVLRSKILRSFFKFSNSFIAVIDKGRANKKALTRVENKIFKQLKTSHQRYADVFEKLGFKVDISNPILLEKPLLNNKVAAITDEKKQQWIGIAPFAAFDPKMYPIDLMTKVIQELSKNHSVFLFGGGKTEIEILSKIEQQTTNCTSVAGKLNLDEELNLIAHLDCMLAMDSGNAHFAAMQQIATITLWGGTHPFAGFAPFNQPKEYCILPDLEKFPNIPCSIYGNKNCEGYEDVMRTILPETVIKKIEEVLNSNS